MNQNDLEALFPLLIDSVLEVQDSNKKLKNQIDEQYEILEQLAEIISDIHDLIFDKKIPIQKNIIYVCIKNVDYKNKIVNYTNFVRDQNLILKQTLITNDVLNKLKKNSCYCIELREHILNPKSKDVYFTWINCIEGNKQEIMQTAQEWQRRWGI